MMRASTARAAHVLWLHVYPLIRSTRPLRILMVREEGTAALATRHPLVFVCDQILVRGHDVVAIEARRRYMRWCARRQTRRRSRWWWDRRWKRWRGWQERRRWRRLIGGATATRAAQVAWVIVDPTIGVALIVVAFKVGAVDF